MSTEKYLQQRGTDCYCPVDENGKLMIGFCLITKERPRGTIGEFYFDDDANIVITRAGSNNIERN